MKPKYCKIICFFGSNWLILSMNKDRIPPKPRQISEATLQTHCFAWFQNNFPELNGLLYHNYNNPRNAIAGARLKSQGLTKGIPDLSLAVDKLLYIELKTEKGILSSDQERIHSQLRKAGFQVAICRSLGEFKNSVLYHLDGAFVKPFSYRWDYTKNELEVDQGDGNVSFVGF